MNLTALWKNSDGYVPTGAAGNNPPPVGVVDDDSAYHLYDFMKLVTCSTDAVVGQRNMNGENSP